MERGNAGGGLFDKPKGPFEDALIVVVEAENERCFQQDAGIVVVSCEKGDIR